MQRAQVAQRMAGALDGVPEHMTDASGVWAEGGHDTSWQGLRHQTHALEDARACEIQFDVVFEDDVHHGKAKGRLGPDHANSGEALQVRRERIRDLVLDLLRAMPRPVGEDDHLVVGEVRDRIDGCGSQSPPAPASQAEVQRDHDETVLQCNVNEAIDHGPRHSSSRALARAHLRCPDLGSEQRHDDCQWLNEEDGQQDVAGNRRNDPCSVWSPLLAQESYGEARGKECTCFQNRRGQNDNGSWVR